MESGAPSKMPVAVWLTAELFLVIPGYVAVVTLVPLFLYSAGNFNREGANFYETGIWLGVLFFFLLRVLLHELIHAWAVLRSRYVVKELTLGSDRWRYPLEFHLFGFSWKVHTLMPIRGTLRFTYTRVVDVEANSAFIHLVPAFFELGCAVLVIGLNLSLLYNASAVQFSPFFYTVFVLFSLFWLSNIRFNTSPLGNNDVSRALSVNNAGERYAEDVYWTILYPKGIPAITLDEALINVVAAPEDQVALGSAAMLCRIKSHSDTDHYFQRFLKVADHPYLRSYALDTWLTWRLVNGDIASLANAEELARELVALEQGSISARGTLGSVLVESGKAQEGKEVLLNVLAASESKIDMLYTCVFLALAERALGNEGAALTHAKNAKMINPSDPVIQRLGPTIDTENTNSHYTNHSGS